MVPSKARHVLNLNKRVYYYKPLQKDKTLNEQGIQQKAKKHG